MSNSLRSHGLQHSSLPCPSPRFCSDPCPLSRWCHPTISSSVIPFSCPQSFSLPEYIHTICVCKILSGSQNGGGIGRGDHFLSYKFIERRIELWTKFTKQLLIASSGHQAPRKAAHCLRSSKGGKKNLFFFFFFLFIFLVFLSYFLLKSSNNPLLFLNFHFHLTITLQKKKKREALFLNRTTYIFKFWVFVFVFKYFISKSLTSMLNFLIFVLQYVI